MSSMNIMINRLLRALEFNGIIYCLDKKQYYSETLNKRCTKYILHRKNEDEIKENHQFNKQLDVVLFLVEQLRGVNS